MEFCHAPEPPHRFTVSSHGQSFFLHLSGVLCCYHILRGPTHRAVNFACKAEVRELENGDMGMDVRLRAGIEIAHKDCSTALGPSLFTPERIEKKPGAYRSAGRCQDEPDSSGACLPLLCWQHQHETP